MGWKGIKRESDTKYFVLEFLSGKKEAGFTEIANYCSKKGISRMTVKKYIDQMKKNGWVSQSLEGRHPYSITKKGIEEAERENKMRGLNKELNKRSLEELILLNKLLVENWLTNSIFVSKKDMRTRMYIFGDPRKVDELRQYCEGSHPPLIIASFHSPPDELPTIEEALKIIEEFHASRPKNFYEKLKQRYCAGNSRV
jgi:predicted transcriptional regulator